MNSVIYSKLFISSIYALRVFPAETRLTVYRRRPVVFQMSFRARQLLKKSPREALQSVIKQSSRFERLKVVQKTNLPLEVDGK